MAQKSGGRRKFSPLDDDDCLCGNRYCRYSNNAMDKRKEQETKYAEILKTREITISDNGDFEAWVPDTIKL